MESSSSPSNPQSPPKNEEADGFSRRGGHVSSRNNRCHDTFRSSAPSLDFDSDCESNLSSDEEMSVDFELEFGKIESSDSTTSRKRKRRSDEDEGDDLETSPKPSKKFFPSSELRSVDGNGGGLASMDCASSLLDSLQMCHLTQDLSNSFASQSIFENHDFDKLNHDFDLSAADFIKAQPVFESQVFNKMMSDSFDLDESDYKDLSLFQAEGLNEVVSCSTQIREALETLTRPAISLTV